MLQITLRCQQCGREGRGPVYPMICKCGGDIRGEGFPGITGTRDSFGIGQNFIDEKTHKEITTWKEWERAGYRSPEIKNHKVKELVKEKMNQLKGQKLRQPLPSELPL